ncbi:hypothetical protein A5821_001689 [Enterococcus sp. 7F3_DIV0205]|uniref:Uncharacterized protein n=1 Tax=Candidatus Enterococcus palustris TaxID=1834189 RepID=A0AAQ3WDQ4_9ENTE|nr:hypothetical protein [Enterococcus sp. 7F3_DIV0205]OTN86084.1 hypothetical protein A5821_002034 [Enterococcus sp. 7F3_DIV0205]
MKKIQFVLLMVTTIFIFLIPKLNLTKESLDNVTYVSLGIYFVLLANLTNNVLKNIASKNE